MHMPLFVMHGLTCIHPCITTNFGHAVTWITLSGPVRRRCWLGNKMFVTAWRMSELLCTGAYALKCPVDCVLNLQICMFQIPLNLAISIKLVPTKLGWAIAHLADGDENKELLVGDVFPKAPAAEASS